MKTLFPIQKTLDFCQVSIYSDYIYVVMNEGITVIPAHNDILIDLANTYFPERDFVYMTHRIHSYSVDPTVYIETSKIKNLRAFIVIAQNFDKESEITKIEKLFFEKPFVLFGTKEEAIAYKDELLSR